MDVKALAVHNEGIRLEFREGRHEDAPDMADEAVQEADWNMNGGDEQCE